VTNVGHSHTSHTHHTRRVFGGARGDSGPPISAGFRESMRSRPHVTKFFPVTLDRFGSLYLGCAMVVHFTSATVDHPYRRGNNT
jgi:hypothetical protein